MRSQKGIIDLFRGARGSGTPDDTRREAIHGAVTTVLDCFVASAFLLRSPSFGGRGRSLSYGGQVAPRNDVATIQIRLRIPAARCTRVLRKTVRPKKRGRRECRVPAAPAASRAK